MPGTTVGGGSTPSRRALLRAGIATALVAGTSACTSSGDDEPQPAPTPPAPDPVVPLVVAHEALLAAYDRTLARHPPLSARLSPVRQEHQEHLAALRALLRDPGAGSPSPSAAPPTKGVVPAQPAAAVAALSRAEGAAQTALSAAALSAEAGDTAAILGSVAASEASHLAVPR